MSSFYLCEIWMLHMASFYSWKRNKMLRMGGFYPYIFISTKKCDVTNVWFDLWIVHTDIAQCMLQNMMLQCYKWEMLHTYISFGILK